MKEIHMKQKLLGLFSGFPTHHFPKEITGKLKAELVTREQLVFISAWPADFDRNNSDSKGMHDMFAECGLAFQRVSVIDAHTDIADAKQMIKNASCIFLMGGNATLQMQLIHEKEIYEEICNSHAVILGVSAGSINMAKHSVDIYESLTPYMGLGLTNITIKAHYNEEDKELVQVLKQVSKALPVCAMKDESAIFIKDGVAEIIGQIFLIDKEEIVPVTENILAKLIN